MYAKKKTDIEVNNAQSIEEAKTKAKAKAAEQESSEMEDEDAPDEEVGDGNAVNGEDNSSNDNSSTRTTSTGEPVSTTLPAIRHVGDVVLTPEKIVEVINETVEVSQRFREEIGDLVLTHAFSNDLKLALSKNPHKAVSYKKICDNPELQVKPKDLGIWLRIAALNRILRDEDPDLLDLSISVKREIVKIDDAKKRLKLAKDAKDGNLSVREVRARVDEMLGISAKDGEIDFTIVKKLLNNPKRLNESGAERIAGIFKNPKAIRDLLNKKERKQALEAAEKKIKELQPVMEFLQEVMDGISILHKEEPDTEDDEIGGSNDDEESDE
jgi:hypothetical protein